MIIFGIEFDFSKTARLSKSFLDIWVCQKHQNRTVNTRKVSEWNDRHLSTIFSTR